MGALAAGVDMAVSFLHVVALGVDVVTEALLAAASYVPPRVSPTQYLRHARPCETSATLLAGAKLGVESPAVRTALRSWCGRHREMRWNGPSQPVELSMK